MLNVTSFNIGEITSKVSLNTPSSGIIQRSHPRSKFVRFHSRSPMSEYAFSSRPRLSKDGPEIVVLQIMVFGNDELLVEYVCEQELTVEQVIRPVNNLPQPVGPIAQPGQSTFSYRFTGTYPLKLIPCRKGSRSHVGSNPTVPTIFS